MVDWLKMQLGTSLFGRRSPASLDHSSPQQLEVGCQMLMNLMTPCQFFYLCCSVGSCFVLWFLLIPLDLLPSFCSSSFISASSLPHREQTNTLMTCFRCKKNVHARRSKCYVVLCLSSSFVHSFLRRRQGILPSGHQTR